MLPALSEDGWGGMSMSDFDNHIHAGTENRMLLEQMAAFDNHPLNNNNNGVMPTLMTDFDFQGQLQFTHYQFPQQQQQQHNYHHHHPALTLALPPPPQQQQHHHHNNNNHAQRAEQERTHHAGIDTMAIFDTFRHNVSQALERPEAVPANCFPHCNHGDAITGGNDLSQARPNGSFKRHYPLPYEKCFCKCSASNVAVSTDMKIGVLRLIDCGLLGANDHVCLNLPSADSNSSNPLAVIGQLKLSAATQFEPRKVQYLDIGTDRLYCCPAAWFMNTYAILSIEGKIPNTVVMAKKIADQLRLDRNCMQFVSCPRLNCVSFTDLFVIYRHHVAKHQYAVHGVPAATLAAATAASATGNAAAIAAAAAQLPAVDYLNWQGAAIPTQAEIVQQFRDATVVWPTEDMWIEAMTRRLREKDSVIKGLSDALSQAASAAAAAAGTR